MKTKILLFTTAFFLSGFTNILNAQTDEQIINEIFFDLFDGTYTSFCGDTIIMGTDASRTHFNYDSTILEEDEVIMDLNVTPKVISEWRKNQENQERKKWNEQYLNEADIIFENGASILKKPVFKLLSREEIDQIFDQTQKRQCNIFWISQMLFDDSRENAIFHFAKIPWWSDFYESTIHVKKTSGKWTIVSRSMSSI